MEDDKHKDYHGDYSKPIMLAGDPSPLTTQLVLREIASLKELLQTRLAGVEKSIDVAHDNLVRFPTEVQKAIASLQDLTDTKISYENKLVGLQINHIEKQFNWIEQVRIEQKRDTATAVDAALKAAKEAVTEQNTSNVLAINKSETATSKQIDQLAILVTTGIKNLDDKIIDVKDRVIGREGSGTGMNKLWGWIVAGLLLAVAVYNAVKT